MNRWPRGDGVAAWALLVLLAGAVPATAAPLKKLTPVFEAGKPLQDFGVSADRLDAFRRAIDAVRPTLSSRREREALDLYKRALELYARLASPASSPVPVTFEQALRAHTDADRRYHGLPRLPEETGGESRQAPDPSSCRIRWP
jgi:hypothetical protein